MNKILIITQQQFGYHTGFFFFAQSLKQQNNVQYLCWDYSNRKWDDSDIDIKYVSRKGPKPLRYYNFIKQCIRQIKKNQYNLIFIHYFRLSSLLPLLFNRRNFLVDIRTGDVRKGKLRRYFNDLLLRYECRAFKNVSILSFSMAKYLKLNHQRIHELPLGSEIISNVDKEFDHLQLLYVGTLKNRNIIETLKGFHMFLESDPRVKCSYTIIGFGYPAEEDEIRNYIRKNKLEKKIIFKGRIPRNELSSFFDNHNIGVSFIPKKPYFYFQPPSKTYEYLLSGFAVIATSTAANCDVVNESNGVLIEDNANAFFHGLKEVYLNKTRFSSVKSRNSCINYTWDNIIQNNLIPYISKIIDEQ